MNNKPNTIVVRVVKIYLKFMCAGNKTHYRHSFANYSLGGLTSVYRMIVNIMRLC